jgi:hypothetical protein
VAAFRLPPAPTNAPQAIPAPSAGSGSGTTFPTSDQYSGSGHSRSSTAPTRTATAAAPRLSAERPTHDVALANSTYVGLPATLSYRSDGEAAHEAFTDHHRDGPGIVDADTSSSRPSRLTAWSGNSPDSTSAHAAPAIRIRLTPWVAVRHQHAAVAHQDRGGDRDPRAHRPHASANPHAPPSGTTRPCWKSRGREDATLLCFVKQLRSHFPGGGRGRVRRSGPGSV